MAVNAGEVTLQLTLDSKKFKKSLDAIGKKTKKQSDTIATNFKKATDNAGKSVTKQFEGANAELQKAEKKLKELQAQAEKWEKDYRASGQMNRAHVKDDSTAELKRSTEEYIKSTRAKFDTLIEAEKRHVAELKASMGDATSTEDVGNEASNTGKKFAKLAGTMAVLKKIGTPAIKALHIGLKGLGFAMKGTAKLFEASCHVIATSFNVLNGLAKVALAGIAFGIGALALLWKQGMSDLIESDTETANSIASLKSALDTLRLALASAFAPIVNIAIPYLVKLINWITSAVTAIGHLISALTGKKTTLVAKKQMGGVGKAVGGIGSSAGKANKQAKELQRTLMGFDKINKLDKANNGSGGGGGGGGGGGAGGAGGLFDTVPVDAQASKFADKLKEAWKKADFTWLGALLAEKINKAMAGIPWDKIKDGAWRIAHSIGTFINGFVENFDWGLLGKTISQAILTMFKFVTTFLETVNWQNIGKAIVDLFAGIQWGKLFKGASRIVGDIAGAIAGIFAGVAKAIGKKIKGYFTKQIKKAGGNVALGLLKGIANGLKNIGKWIVNNLFKPFIKGFKKAFGISSPSKKMKEQGVNIIAGLLEGLKDKIKDVFDWFKELPSKILSSIGDKFKLSNLFDFDLDDSFLGGLLDKITDKKATVKVGLEKDNNDWDAQANTALGAGGQKLFSTLFQSVQKGSEWIAEAVTASNKSGNVNRTLTQNVAKGSWASEAYNVALKAGDVARTLVQAVKKKSGKSNWNKEAYNASTKGGGTVERTLKIKVTAYATKVYRAIRSALVGAMPSLGKKMPYLASGGWIGKNTPQLAVVGDNRREGEFVAPESKLKAMAQDVANNSGGDNTQVVALLTQLLRAVQGMDTNVYLDGKEIANNTVKRINQQTRTTGQSPLLV